PTRSNSVVLPNSEQRKEPRRKSTVHGQMRPDNAVPILHYTAGSHGLIPSSQKIGCSGSPRRVNALQQLFVRRAKHLSAQPCPGQQGNCLRSQGLLSLLLDAIKPTRKQQGLLQGQA